jgi:glycosyltransferase involved in cell wall biosynthesis
MRIGFDAKRTFFNFSGLGNYSRSIINLLSEYYPDNRYYLYIPKQLSQEAMQLSPNQYPRFPGSGFSRTFHPLWRSWLVSSQLSKDKLDIYHGLSNELPRGLDHQGLKKVVTIHDLIFMREPHLYPFIDRRIYIAKSRYSCEKADRIIAISNQTKIDLVEYLHVPEEKIDVVYQPCNPIFTTRLEKKEIKKILSRHNLPSDFILYVGTIEERKNLLSLIHAMESGSIDIPLVAVGRHTPYAAKVKHYIARKNIRNMIFIENLPTSDLPALYQKAQLFVYPSTFEGFGLPVLEALYSRTPVITGWGEVFREAGGEHTICIHPSRIEELSAAIKRVLTDTALRKKMIKKGYKHALSFNREDAAKNVMKVYKRALKG